MPKWIPEQIWKDRDVYIIGGGDSLEKFDWDILKSHFTIGCNDAYQLGKDVCKICFFGDEKWLEKHKSTLEIYANKGGIVFTNSPKLYKTKIPWLWVTVRESSGLHKNSIAWNYNTGAAAINLALILGAKRIFLLGFDMKLSRSGKANWHQNLVDKPNSEVYPKFLEGFSKLAKSLNSQFPGIEVINITDDSDLNEFKKIGTKEFWRTKKNYVVS